MIVDPTNLDYLVSNVRMRVGDLTSTQFTDTVIRTALVYGVQALGPRWNNRYFIFRTDMAISATQINTPAGIITVTTLPNANDAFRNTFQTFVSEEPPVIDQTDETPIVLSASILVRRSVITSSVSAFSNWSTPDLTYSNVQASKSLLEMINADNAELNTWFKSRLASAKKDAIPQAILDRGLSPAQMESLFDQDAGTGNKFHA